MKSRSNIYAVLLIAVVVAWSGLPADAACPASIENTSVRLRLASSNSIVSCVSPNTNYRLEVFGPSSNNAYCASSSGTIEAPLATIGYSVVGGICQDATNGDIPGLRGFSLRTDRILPQFGIVGAVSPTCAPSYRYLEEYAFSYPPCSLGGLSCLAPPTGMVAWYGFDTTSSAVVDLAGSNDATRSGAVSVSGGRVGRGVDFDGSNDYVRASDHSSLDFGTGDFSIDAWIRTSDTNGVIASKRANTSGRYVGYLLMVYNGRLLLQMADPVNSWRNYGDLNGPNVADGNWHLVAVTVDRDNPSGGRIFLDGELIFTFDPRSRSGSLSNSATLDIGQATNGGSGFDGVIDEVELFDRALSAAEVRALQLVGSDGKCKPAQPAPLQVSLICSTLGTRHFCEANTFGGSGGYSYLWSLSGNGSLNPNGSSASILRSDCDASSRVSVRVSDSSGTQVLRSLPLHCDDCDPAEPDICD